MTISDLKDLSKIIDLCRKKGVQSIEIDNVKLTLNEEAPRSSYKRKADAVQAAPNPTESSRLVNEAFESDAPSPDDMLLWSVRGSPGEDDKNKIGS